MLRYNDTIRAMEANDLEDICAVVGYTRTRMLQSWYGGKWVYLPAKPDASHALAHLLGEPALRALWKRFRVEFGQERLWVPTDGEAARYDRRVKAARMLVEGQTVVDIARRFGLTQSAAEAMRRELLRERWVAYDMAGPRRYRLAAIGRRRKILGTSEVFDEPPGGGSDDQIGHHVTAPGQVDIPLPLDVKGRRGSSN